MNVIKEITVTVATSVVKEATSNRIVPIPLPAHHLLVDTALKKESIGRI